jgi:hypothetical protein
MATVTGTANNDTLFINSGKSNDTLLGLAGNDYLDALAGAGNNILSGGDGNDELFAYTKDQLFGDAGDDILTSDGNGNNTLNGGSGNDTLFADRNDFLIGDAGDDVFFGGLGGNTITGGLGKDVFWVAVAEAPTAPNTITDFNSTSDTVRINLTGVTKFSDLVIAQVGNDVTISVGGQQLALLKNTKAASLNENTVVLDANSPNNSGNNLSSYEFTNLPKLGTTSKGQDILLGGFSGLYFQGTAANGNLKFVTNTDRGPNGDPTGQNRPFYLPDFQPEIVSFELNQATGAISITKRTGLFRADGTTKLTGLPNLQAQANGLAYTDEIAVDLDGKTVANDPLGGDFEGIVVADNGDYWLVDEYRPAIYRFDKNGKLLDRFIPIGTAVAPEPDQAAGAFGTEVLPAVYAQRRSNRGFEAVALEGTKLYAFMQSPIDNPDNAADTASRASRNVRILEFDTVTKKVTGEYLYLLDDITGSGNAKTDKLGDAVSLGNGRFAVVERDDLATTSSNKLIYQIDLAGATNISNPLSLPVGKTIEQLSPEELSAAKITPVSKSLIVNAAKAGYTGVEKLEGLALVNANTLALINDNDFNVSGAKVPEKLGLLELTNSLNLPLKFTKNNSDIFSIVGGNKSKSVLSFTVNGSKASQVNELGVFIVDDALGTVDGFAPGQTGYSEKAMSRARVILSTIDNNPVGFSGGGLQRLLEFNSNDRLQFYSVNAKSSTTDSVFQTKSFTNVSFLSGAGLSLKDLGSNEFSINFKDLTINIKPTDENLILGTALQGQQAGEVLDLRSVDKNLVKQVKADFSIHREAAYNNFVGFYQVENENGDIKTANGTIVSVGSASYTKLAVENRIAGIDLNTADNSTQIYTNKFFNPGGIFAPFIIINNSPTAVTGSSNDPDVYFSYLGANKDGVDHIRLLGNNTFGFEDIRGGGDFDYNDIIIKATLTPVV